MATKIDWITGIENLSGKSPKEYYRERFENLVEDFKKKSMIITCPICYSKNRGFRKFCQKCGTELKNKNKEKNTRELFIEYNQSMDLKDLDEEDHAIAINILNKEFKL
ncbi:MAG: hypothetical protein EU540_00780 [Promethearchaeota archaeon]|nr:MAG: hypothetical protein EU540_00780 [Candidatus Lokiarchaeota archaeon]